MLQVHYCLDIPDLFILLIYNSLQLRLILVHYHPFISALYIFVSNLV
jgi:hypothetical protein